MAESVTQPAVGASPTPLFSIVTPVYEPPLDVLEDTVRSVLAQTCEDWEWILVDDNSPSQEVRDLIAAHAERDPRIRLVARTNNGHIVRASNDGIEAARGEFIVLLDHDDLLTPDALAINAARIASIPHADYLYSDEDKVGEDGVLYDEFRKPAWSPERLRGQMYTSHLSVMRTSVVREVGGFRDGYDGSQDHDLALRVSEKARRVVHIAKVLYHWRAVAGSAAADANAKPYATIAGAAAVQDHFDRLGIAATVSQGKAPGHYRISRALDPARTVSIIIPTRGSEALIWGVRRVMVVDAVRSLLAKTEHPNVEIVVVHDTPTPPAVLDALRRIAGDKLRLVEFDEPFSYSRKMNLGCLHATGERLVFLNDDVEVISDHWLEELVAPLDEPDCGMTGAMLYFADDTIQHAGHGYYNHEFMHPGSHQDRGLPGAFGSWWIGHEVSGVTAACSAMRSDTFHEVGGFSEQLPVNFNDVDLSFKVRHLGLRIVWLPVVELYHFESKTRVREVNAWEVTALTLRWGRPSVDPYVVHAVAGRTHRVDSDGVVVPLAPGRTGGRQRARRVGGAGKAKARRRGA